LPDFFTFHPKFQNSDMKTSANNNSRLFYIDNLRIFLISLVVLHHLSITYGAPGSWYYNESQAGSIEALPLSMFVATNQSFFMGMFFFISAFFIVSSLERKGGRKFFSDRFIRLGIPLLVYFFVLSPLTVFIHNRIVEGSDVSLFNYIFSFRKTGFGPLWFVEALLIFTLIYFAVQPLKIQIDFKFPKAWIILLFAFLTGFLQFAIRIWLPAGWSMPFTGFQLPFFAQYIFLFAIGIIAYQNNWLNDLTFKTGKQWFIFAQLLIFIGFPLLFVVGGAGSGNLDPFMGGLHWQSLGYALWEQLVGFSLIIGLFGISKQLFNHQGRFARQLSDSAYGVFVFHAPIIVGISAIFRNWEIFPPLKFLILAPVALIVNFGIAWVIKKMPVLKNIF